MQKMDRQKTGQFTVIVEAPTTDFQSWLKGYIKDNYGQDEAGREMAQVYVGGLNRGIEYKTAFLPVGPLTRYSKGNVARFQFKFLGSNRTKLLAQCWDPVFWPKFGELLAAIIEWWPGKHQVMEPVKARLEAVIAERWPTARQGIVLESEPELCKLIDDHGYDRALLELWWKGHTAGEIAARLSSVTEKTVRNRLTLLRQKYGEEIVPYKKQLRKLGQKLG